MYDINHSTIGKEYLGDGLGISLCVSKLEKCLRVYMMISVILVLPFSFLSKVREEKTLVLVVKHM